MADTPDKRAKRSEERERLIVARRLAASSEKREAIKDWLARRDAMHASRGGDLVVPDHTADLAALQARLRVRALTICEDILLHSVSEAHQLKAIELVMSMDASVMVVQPPATQAQVVDDVPREEKIRILRALTRTG